MFLVIDNYDSFIYNIVNELALLSVTSEVVRNDKIDIARVLLPLDSGGYEGVIMSPGPSGPDSAGGSVDLIRQIYGRVPFLGVCLGLQCLAEAQGGETIRAKEPVHGEASEITLVKSALFGGLPEKIMVARYHSLVTNPAVLPDNFDVIATNEDGYVMALSDDVFCAYGLQFHPESYLMKDRNSSLDFGRRITDNFIGLARSFNVSRR